MEAVTSHQPFTCHVIFTLQVLNKYILMVRQDVADILPLGLLSSNGKPLQLKDQWLISPRALERLELHS